MIKILIALVSLDTVFPLSYKIKFSQKHLKYHCLAFQNNLLQLSLISQKYNLNDILQNPMNKYMIFTKNGRNKTFHYSKKIVKTSIISHQSTITNRTTSNNRIKKQNQTNRNNFIP